MIEGTLGWVVVVNLIIWSGLFVYLLYLNKKIRAMERSSDG